MLFKFVSNMSAKERKVFYITVLVVGIALLDRLFLNPVLGHLSRLDKEIEKERALIMSDRKVLAHQDRIKKEGEAFKKYFMEDVPDDDVVNATFLRLIEKMASQNNVGLAKSTPSHVNKTEMLNEYFASVDCSGSLPDVMAFMHTVNTADELIKVTQFNMAPQRGVDNAVRVSMTIVKTIIH